MIWSDFSHTHTHWPFCQREREGERHREKTLVSVQTISSHPRMSKQFISGSWRRVLWTRTEPQEWGQTTCQNDQRGKRNKACLFPSASTAKAFSFLVLASRCVCLCVCVLCFFSVCVCENRRMDRNWGLGLAAKRTPCWMEATRSVRHVRLLILSLREADEVSLIAGIMQSSAS